MRVTVCPDCEEPIGSVERYCWNCGVPVDRPALVLSRPFVTHDNARGFRGRCPCGWVGEWRGYRPWAVEDDIEKHRCEEPA